MPLAVKLGPKDADTCCIPAGPGQRVHQSRPDHILCRPDDRNRSRRPLGRANSNIPGSIDDVDLSFDKLRRKFWNQINARSIWVPIDGEILALDETKPAKFIKHRDKRRRIAWTSGHAAEAIGPSRLLRLRCQRPRHGRATNQCDELAPSHRLPPRFTNRQTSGLR